MYDWMIWGWKKIHCDGYTQNVIFSFVYKKIPNGKNTTR